MNIVGIVWTAGLFVAAGCGGAKYSGVAGFRGPAESTGAMASPAAEIAGEGGPISAPARPQAGQLTAGVWDDNLNFEWFAAYASRMQRAPDLGVFTPDEQRGARDAFAQPATRSELDVQLVLDTTGSMGDELRYLQSEFDSIARQVRSRFPELTPRWSLVLYRDRGDDYVVRPFDFTSDTEQFRRRLAAQSADGGGDFPEAVLAGLGAGLDQRWRSEPAVARLVFWVADAPPHAGEGGRFADVVRRARGRGVHIYPIASSGIDDATEYQMRAAAQLTGGRYLFLTDDSGIGNPHAEPHIPCYQVTRLDHAVVRMIEVELAGRHIAPGAEDVIRRIGAQDEAGRCTVGAVNVVAF